MRCLENEIGAPNGEEPTNPSEDQPWEDVRVLLVGEWWTRVGKGSLESPKVTVGRRNQVGFVGCDDDGGGNRGGENDDDSEYRGGDFDSVPHYGFGERWPEEEEEEHGTLVGYHELVLGTMSIVETGRKIRVTYEDGGGVDTSEDGERTNADDIGVEQRGTGLITLYGFLKVEIPIMAHGRLASGTSRSARG